MTTRLLIGDVRDRMTQLEAGSFDLIVTSPPFYALRSYLPADHPDKHREIGSEATPGDYLDTLLELTAEWRRLLAPHGSIAIELGDTYAGSGGAGGDYDNNGMRDGQPRFNGTARRRLHPDVDGRHRDSDPNRRELRYNRNEMGGPGHPLEKSLCGIPQAYMLALAYGHNPINGRPSPAGRWRVRNYKPWIRSNPPVGALGDKERPATSYVTVACVARDRWFDLDAVRTGHSGYERPNGAARATAPGQKPRGCDDTVNPAGAPPLDWNVDADTVIDTEIDRRAGKRDDYQRTTNGPKADGRDGTPRFETRPAPGAVGARGHHIRRALQAAGILPPFQDAYDISPKGYSGSHYAVFPKELVRQIIDEMAPRRVCTECGQPSRRIVGEAIYERTDTDRVPARLAMTDGARVAERVNQHHQTNGANTSVTRVAPTLGWSDCGHNTWRPGRILDPFTGSGTTLAVASGMARDSVGIDLDPRSADLARERVGFFLEVDDARIAPNDATA